MTPPLVSSHANILFRTCYYVLGLIAKTEQGVEILGELGWEGVVSPNGVVEGLCVPVNLREFLSVSIVRAYNLLCRESSTHLIFIHTFNLGRSSDGNIKANYHHRQN
jgi:Rapamycin-insensitive companion of mTOR, domain 5